LGLITALHEINLLAEFGVILLLFTIGMEFSFGQLAKIKSALFVGGGTQAGLTIALGGLLAVALGVDPAKAVFWGFLLALSSTAIVLRLLNEQRQTDSPHGRISLAILIFQDLLIVPLMLLVPLLAGQPGNGDGLWVMLGKAVLILALVFLAARWGAPWALHRLALTRSRELFLLSICALALSVTWLTNWAGLSLGLGAFLAGLIIAESEYSHYALANILPFRDVFASFFFVSIGMLLDLSFFVGHLPQVAGLAVLVVLLKALATLAAVFVLGLGAKIGILVGLALAQIGEFSFVLSKVGKTHGLLSEGEYQYFLAVSILTLGLTPLWLKVAQPMAESISRLPLPGWLRRGFADAKLAKPPAATQKTLQNHLVILGFGLTGRVLAQAAQVVQRPFVVLEMNPEMVRSQRAKGVPIVYGDATQEDSLHQIKISQATMVVIALSDARAAEGALLLIKRLHPDLYVLVRANFVGQLERLYSLGADEVIVQEYETAVEIFGRVLHRLGMPLHEIHHYVEEVRQDGYKMVRGFKKSRLDFSHLLKGIEVVSLPLDAASPLAGLTIAASELRKRFQVSIIAIRRGEEVIPNPNPETRLQPLDHLIVIGSRQALFQAAAFAHVKGAGLGSRL